MYLYKINMIDGKSYIVKSSISNVETFLRELFKVDIMTYELGEYLPNDKFIPTDVAILSNKVVSVECACE